jgi:hypothetical protein
VARESHQLREQTIPKIPATIEAVVYGGERVATTKCRQFQVHQDRAQNVATTWSDTDHQKAQEPLVREIHQVTPAKGNLLDKIFEYHERQLLQNVRTKATGPRCKFAKKLAVMKTVAANEAYAAANMPAKK